MSESMHPYSQSYDLNIIRDTCDRLADAEQLSAIRDDLISVSIAIAPILMHAGTKADLQAAIDRCTLNIIGKIGRSYVDY